MKAAPPITIGLPVYNREKYLRTSLEAFHLPKAILRV
jgi:hypothetical protein